MASQMMLLNECLPMSALKLGCLVESVQTPAMDAYIPESKLPPESILSITAKSFQGYTAASDSTSFKLALTKLLGASHENDNENEAALKSTKINRYMLKQPKQLFKALCLGDEKARAWLNDGIQANSKSYFVVELQTAQNATILQNSQRRRSTGASLTLPTSTIATAGADILGVGKALDASLDIDRNVSDGSGNKFELEDEMIFAIGYKKILWKSWGFRRKEIDKAVLDTEITWSLLGKQRGREDSEEIVSVDLADDLQARVGGPIEDEYEEEQEGEDEELAQLLKNVFIVGDQTFLVPNPSH